MSLSVLLANGQPFHSIQTVNALVVDMLPLTNQQQMKAAIPKTGPFTCQRS